MLNRGNRRPPRNALAWCGWPFQKPELQCWNSPGTSSKIARPSGVRRRPGDPAICPARAPATRRGSEPGAVSVHEPAGPERSARAVPAGASALAFRGGNPGPARAPDPVSGDRPPDGSGRRARLAGRCVVRRVAGAALLLIAVLPVAAGSARADDCPGEVPVTADWALTPAGLDVGDTFRLLFLTSTERDATSSNIADYNRFVQDRAAAGHAAVRPYAGDFRVVGSTSRVNARNNTCTTGTGVPIHWLNGSRLADDYGDFYDGSWDDEVNRTNESGGRNGSTWVWTGSNHNGTEDYDNDLGAESVAYGLLAGSRPGPLAHADNLSSQVSNPFYGLSPVFRIIARPAPGTIPRATGAEILSAPGDGTTYRAGETITLRLRMDLPVTVTGRPSIGLDVGNEQRRAVYSGPAGAATTALDFSYTVRSGDFDSDGVGLCAPGRPGCGRIRLDGGSIRSLFDGTDASPGHPVLAAQSGHKVEAAPLDLSSPTSCRQEIWVKRDWALTPSGLNAGDRFRLLFVTSGGRGVRSSNITDYNHFVQASVAAGHAEIGRYGGGFRVVGSTSRVHARNNTCTTGTGVRIHWLNGNKVADSYADFYDGSWDNVTERSEYGAVISSGNSVATGSNNNGTRHARYYLGARGVRIGDLSSNRNPLSSATFTGSLASFLGLSQVFRVIYERVPSVRIASRPAAGGVYRAGERIRIEADFSEPLAVRGAPGLLLNIRRADGTEGEYEAGLFGHQFHYFGDQSRHK